MIVMFTARRLKPGAWDQFRRAWDPGDNKPPGFQRAYHARNIRDEDEIISFGLFDMSKDDYHRWRGEHDDDENARVDTSPPSSRTSTCRASTRSWTRWTSSRLGRERHRRFGRGDAEGEALHEVELPTSASWWS